ncbi:Uncharacterised protein [Klebsiella pneumoniae]|nr:Uncharacterised protein [Klebsiella pneumoniae]
MNMHLSQVIPFQIKTLGKRMQADQYTVLPVPDPLTMGFHQPVTGLIPLHQQLQT